MARLVKNQPAITATFAGPESDGFIGLTGYGADLLNRAEQNRQSDLNAGYDPQSFAWYLLRAAASMDAEIRTHDAFCPYGRECEGR